MEKAFCRRTTEEVCGRGLLYVLYTPALQEGKKVFKEQGAILRVPSGMGKAHTLWMPLDAENGKVFVIKSFHDEIMGVLRYAQSRSQSSHSLMVGAVYDRTGAVKPEWEGTAGGLGGMDTILLIPGMNREGCRIQILDDFSAKACVYDLDALADSEDRLSG